MTISEITPQLRTTDLDESIEFYVSRLGFELEFKYSDFYAGIKIGNQHIHLKLVDEEDPSIEFVAAGNHLHLYFTTNNARGDADRMKQNGVAFYQELEDTPWQSREFSIRDNQGHIICFGESLA